MLRAMDFGDVIGYGLHYLSEHPERWHAWVGLLACALAAARNGPAWS